MLLNILLYIEQVLTTKNYSNYPVQNVTREEVEQLWPRVRHQFKEQQISELGEQVKMRFRVNYEVDK